jgi:hypothetical protein
VLLGLGNGDFAPAVTYPVGAAPSAVRLSDVDGDGDLDIVASNFGSANLSVLQNLSNGSFLPATTYGTGPGAGFFDVADLNGDGAVDIAVSTRSVPGISVLFNAGSGSFQPVVSFGSGPYAEIAAVDVDDDGDIDLTPVGGDAFLGNGSGSFAPAAADPFPTPNYPSIVSGDLDGDGDLDLAITTSAGLSTRLNLGSGSFAPAVTTPYAPGMIGIFSVLRVGDFDGDGDLDAVVTWNGSIFVHFNQGNGTMGPATTLAIGVQYWYVQLADVNGDGRPDILGVGNGQVYAAMGTSSGPAPFAPIGGTASNGWTFADMDGDGDLDEVFSSNGALYYSRNNGAGVLGSIVQIAALPNASAVSAADLDGDGLVDVVASVNAVNLTGSRLFKNLGAGSFAPPIALGESNVAPEFIDFDHDGDLDLLCNLFDYALLIENLGSFQFAPPVRIGAARSGLTHLDLDVDGDEDLVGCANGGVFVLENRAVSGTPYCLGDGSATACPCGNSSPSGAQAGCVNSGGRAGKLVARGSTSLLTETARLEGSGMTNSSVLYFQGTTSVSGGAGFVFGDGLRCVGGSLVRLGVAQNSNGASIWPPPNGPSLREAGHVTAPGARFYQAWYRDAQNYCTPATFDLSNGWRFVWRP